MAADVTLKACYRPKISGQTSGVPLGMADADHILLILDRFSDGLVMHHHKLLFADYTGLETEWDTGTATTVLDAAIAAEMSEITWPTLPVTATQRAYVGAAFDEAL